VRGVVNALHDSPICIAEWLKIAYDDFDSALHLFNTKHPKPLEIICYHCQQSVEKALKAFLC
jgi:HEPN domain-containing protein